MIKLAYIAGPYSAPTLAEQLANVAAAQEVAKKLTLQGYITVTPHKQTEGWDYDSQFADWTHSDWMSKYCLPLLMKCDAIAMVPGWEHSKGATMEYCAALAHGIEVIEPD